MRWEAANPLPTQERLEPEQPYLLSCRAFLHEPVCVSFVEHVRRLQRERLEAGGEAQLKAKVGFWRRLK